MKNKALYLLLSASILGGCGGGESNQSSTPSTNEKTVLTGIVATGLPLANASVTVKCNDGLQFIGEADANGRFNIPLEKIGNMPCMLRAEKSGKVYFSYAEKDGNININPLTDLTLSKALKDQPQNTFDKFGNSVRTIDRRDIDDATQFSLSAMEVISGYKTINYAGGTPDPFTYKFDIGDDRDKLFDALAASTKNSNISYDQLRALFIDKAEYREHFAEEIWQDVIEDKIHPIVTNVVCNDNKPIILNSHVALKCVISGKNLTYPSKNQLSSERVLQYPLGISVSRKSLGLSRPSSELPYTPVLCSPQSTSIDSAKSTDSDDPYGTDPTGAFKEELTYSCSSIDTSFEDELEVEVIQYRHPRNSLGQEQAGYAWLRYFDIDANKFREPRTVFIGKCPQGSTVLNGQCISSPVVEDQCKQRYFDHSNTYSHIILNPIADKRYYQENLWVTQESIKILESSECVQSNWVDKNSLLIHERNLYQIFMDTCLIRNSTVDCIAKKP